MKHAVLSPSGAKKWLNCSGSILLESTRKKTSSKYADEGTAAHEVGSQAFMAYHPKAKFLSAHEAPQIGSTFSFVGKMMYKGQDGAEWFCDEEMARYVSIYVSNVEGYFMANTSNKLWVEQSLPISQYTGEEGAVGTSDAVILCEAEGELQVHDLKYGKGVQVSAEENEQLQIYALAALDKYDPFGFCHQVRLVIHQPRVTPQPSEWTISVSELRQWAQDIVIPAAKLATDVLNGAVAPTFNPSKDVCRWCTASGSCKAQTGRVYELVAGQFESVEDKPREPTGLTAEERTTIFINLDLIKTFIKAVESSIITDIQRGIDFPQLKVVEGRKGHKKWAPQAKDSLVDLLGDERFEPQSLISPTEALKIAKIKGVTIPNELIVVPAGKATVVSITDKRPPLANIADAFKDEEDAS